jgi:hypothetical protein
MTLDQLISLWEDLLDNTAVAGMAGDRLVLLLAGLAPLILKSKTGALAPIVVGAKTFTEQYVWRVPYIGFETGRFAGCQQDKFGIYHPRGPCRRKSDCYVDYSDDLGQCHEGSDIPPGGLLEQMTRWLQEKHG